MRFDCVAALQDMVNLFKRTMHQKLEMEFSFPSYFPISFLERFLNMY
jgi:hypothetical protein